jgi:membrane peptidoglycan carboxypeptidase
LEKRKNLVLTREHDLHFITDKEFDEAKAEKVVFKQQQSQSIKAPHFVFFIKDYLEQKYGVDMVESGGLKVITTLDYNLQQIAEKAVAEYTIGEKKQLDDLNAGFVAIDPKTGQLLVMVGSRNYFDKEIDGNFNVTTARRQPGSSFKPYMYATAFKDGYTPDTVLFDVPTEFNASCDPYHHPKSGTPASQWYMPVNYDGLYHGPLDIRTSLGSSMNVPAVKTLYLAGMSEALKTASDMGITTLNDPERLGLTLVLGGGEVSLLELTSAYSGFANDGVRNVPSGILKITGSNGDVLEEYKENSYRGIDQNIARTISSILSDNRARAPAFGEQNALNFGEQVVAAKTGTTNDYRDAWVVGYTPTLTVGAWAGNNNNRPMQKKVAGQIVAPMWHEFMNYALSKYPSSGFAAPDPIENESSLPPVLRGSVQRENGVVHDILYWVDKDNPRSGPPTNPQNDPQFPLWEYGVERFMSGGGEVSSSFSFVDQGGVVNTNESDSVIRNFPSGKRPFSQPISFSVASVVNGSSVSNISISFNGKPISNYTQAPFYISFSQQEIAGVVREENIITINIKTSSGDSVVINKNLSIDLNR